MLFCTLLYRHCTTTTGKCLISRFMEDVNKRRAKFLCLSELEYGSWEFGSKRVRLHLKKISHLSWSNHDRDWKKPNSLVKRSFRGRRRRGILNSLITPMKVIHYLTGKERGWGGGHLEGHTCLTPTVFWFHITLKFQKKGPLHLSQTSLCDHSGV